MIEAENNRPSSGMEEIYKDFAIIHANSERAMNLLRGLDEKLKKAIAVHSPTPQDGDRWHQFYALRMNCVDCTMALLRQFDSGFGQDILIEVEVSNLLEEEKEEAIAEEGGYPIPPEWIEIAKANNAADIAYAMAESVEFDAEEGEAIAPYPSAPAWTNALIKEIKKIEQYLGYRPEDIGDPVEDYELNSPLRRLTRISRFAHSDYLKRLEREKAIEAEEITPTLIKLLLELSQALGERSIPEDHRIRESDGLQLSIAKLVSKAQQNNLRQKRKDRLLSHAVAKIQNLVLPLLNIAIDADSEDEDGNWNEDKDTLMESAADILEHALREIGEADIPY